MIYRSFNIYEIGKLFYSQKIYTFSKKLFICTLITYQDSIVSQTFHLISRKKNLLTSHISNKKLSFFPLYQARYKLYAGLRLRNIFKYRPKRNKRLEYQILL